MPGFLPVFVLFSGSLSFPRLLNIGTSQLTSQSSLLNPHSFPWRSHRSHRLLSVRISHCIALRFYLLLHCCPTHSLSSSFTDHLKAFAFIALPSTVPPLLTSPKSLLKCHLLYESFSWPPYLKWHTLPQTHSYPLSFLSFIHFLVYFFIISLHRRA